MKSPVYEPLSAQDASFVFFEHPATHMHVAALAIFEVGPLRSATGGVDAVRLARYGEAQIAMLPRYRQKLVFTPLSGRPVWVDDPHFDLDYHLRHTALPAPGSAQELKRLVGRVLSQPLDRDRPLWEMWLIEGLERDRFALLIKVHHCMMDGVAGASLLTTLFRAEPDDTIPKTVAWPPRAAPSPLRLVFDEAMNTAGTPLALARTAVGAVRTARTDAAPRARTHGLGVGGAEHRLAPAVGDRTRAADRAAPAGRVAGLRPRADQGAGPPTRRQGERRGARHRDRRDAAIPRAPRRAP